MTLCNDFFSPLIRNEQGLRLIVSKDQSQLPTTVNGNDVDILTNFGDIRSWLQLINDICIKKSYSLKVDSINYYVVKLRVVNLEGETLYIDLNYSYTWYYFRFCEFDYLAEGLRKENSVFRVAKNKALYLNFCHSFLYGGFINKKYIDNLEISTLKNHVQELYNQQIGNIGLDFSKLTARKSLTNDLFRIKLLLYSFLFMPLRSTKISINNWLSTRKIKVYVEAL